MSSKDISSAAWKATKELCAMLGVSEDDTHTMLIGMKKNVLSTITELRTNDNVDTDKFGFAIINALFTFLKSTEFKDAMTATEEKLKFPAAVLDRLQTEIEQLKKKLAVVVGAYTELNGAYTELQGRKRARD